MIYHTMLINDGNGYLLEVTSDGNVRFMLDEDSTKDIATTGIDLKDAVWHHVAAVLDKVGTTSIMRIYVDGELSKFTTFSGFTIATSRDDVFIGRRGASHSTAEYFDGLILTCKHHDRFASLKPCLMRFNLLPHKFFSLEIVF